MSEWLTTLSTWIVQLIKSIFSAIGDLVRDAVVWVLDAVLGALGTLIAAIPAPAFLSQAGGLGSVLSDLPPFALYVIQNARIGEALALISAGVAFNLARKVFTLGQW